MYNVLVVDDDPTIRTTLDFSLTLEGFGTATAGTGAEALTQMRAVRPDVVLLDVMMPQMSGIEVARSMRTDPSLSQTPIILLTAKAEDADVWSGWQAGIDSYVTKPFDLGDLLAQIHRVAGSLGVAA